jgi:nucleoside 2-deoxyribosyltransferase
MRWRQHYERAEKRSVKRQQEAGCYDILNVDKRPLSEAEMLIYFAAPLFSEAERAFNLQLAEKLEARGLTVFLPQRDGVESSRPPYNEMTNDELCRTIFAVDRDKILEADIFLFVLDGRVPDEGGGVELGIAYGQKHLLQRDRLLIGLQTDWRAAFLWAKLNPMIHGALDCITDNENDLMAALEEYGRAMADGTDPAQDRAGS